MLPILQIGPVALPTSGFLILIGAYFGLTLSERRLPQGKLTANDLYNLVFLAILAGIIGARLSFVVQNLSLFKNSILNIFSLDSSLLDLYGGATIAFIALIMYGSRKNLPFWPTLDAFTPLFAVIAIALGLAHAASGRSFGIPTSLPWGIDLWGQTRHPTQFYETIAALIILALLWRGLAKPIFPGRNFLLFCAYSATARLFLDTWRGDSSPLPGGFRVAQVLVWVLLALALFLLERGRQKAKNGSRQDST